MFYQDPQSQQWILHPDYYSHFENENNINTFLYQTPNEEWNQADMNCYMLYITGLS